MPTQNDRRFAWTSFYSEVANKLLQYKDDRGPLAKAFMIDYLSPGRYEYLGLEGMPDILGDISPFTVMAAFNLRGCVTNDFRQVGAV